MGDFMENIQLIKHENNNCSVDYYNLEMAENIEIESQSLTINNHKKLLEGIYIPNAHTNINILSEKSANLIPAQGKSFERQSKQARQDQYKKKNHKKQGQTGNTIAQSIQSDQQSPLRKRRNTTYTSYNQKESTQENEEDEKITIRKNRKLSMINNNHNTQIENISPKKKHHYLKRRPPAIDMTRIIKEQHLLRFSQEDYAGNILQPSKKMQQNQKDLNQTILHIKQGKSRAEFLFSGVPLGTRMTFEIIIEKDSIFGRQYSFWLAGQQGKVLLMHSKKNLKLLEDYYIINQYVQNLNCFSFIAKLQSNLLRKQFILSNQTDYNQDPCKQIFADISVYPSPNRQNTYAVYFPAFGKVCNRQTIIKGYQDPNILKQLATQNQYIDYLAPCQVLPIVTQNFMQKQELVSTHKSISLMGRQGQLKFYSGKVESKKYRLYLGSGVSPLIAFATFMVLYQS